MSLLVEKKIHSFEGLIVYELIDINSDIRPSDNEN